MSSHNLSIESGRHRNILRNNRICEFCRSEIEDEYHFVLICPRYQQLRVKYIKMYYWKKPSMYKFIQLLCVNNVKELCNLGKFLHHAFELRNDWYINYSTNVVTKSMCCTFSNDIITILPTHCCYYQIVTKSQHCAAHILLKTFHMQ